VAQAASCCLADGERALQFSDAEACPPSEVAGWEPPDPPSPDQEQPALRHCMNFLPFIEAKRDGRSLEPHQIREMISAYASGFIPDYQMSAFLMAVCFQGLNPNETRALTLAMRDSGDVLSFPVDSRPLVDKHSTGGVGDKVSLPLAPLLACLGFRVPMISGRGLGITGGTLDKLGSIPGFKASLASEYIVEVVQQVGCVICGQTDLMVPADKKLYALRDVTGTIPSPPLMVASILSKKLAENLDALVLDVKFGSAAFMPTLDRARSLAQAMVSLATETGVNTRALLTNMDTPLGRSVGNWLEVREAVDCLQPGRGKNAGDELRELVIACAAHLLVQTGKEKSLAAALVRAEQCLASGEPRNKWDEMLSAQGADVEAFRARLARHAPVVLDLHAWRTGFVTRCDARTVGETVRELGGGRLTKETVIDFEVGVDKLSKPGEWVEAGSTLGRVHAREESNAKAAAVRLRAAFEIADRPGPRQALIAEVVGA